MHILESCMCQKIELQLLHNPSKPTIDFLFVFYSYSDRNFTSTCFFNALILLVTLFIAATVYLTFSVADAKGY